MSFGAKFIETSVGIQHNVDELLVGVLKQIRLRMTSDSNGTNAGNSSSSNAIATKKAVNATSSMLNCGGGGKKKTDKAAAGSSSAAAAKKAISSPLHTLQVARDILAKVCLNASQSSITKSCENLHVL